MKIVRIIARLNVGGPARHVVWLTGGLQDEMCESLLVAGTVPAGEDDMSYFARDNGISPVYIKEMSREISWRDAIAVWKLYRLLVRERPDIVHTHTAKAGTVGRVAAICYRWLTPAVLAGRPRPCKVVHTYHGHIFHSYYGTLKTGVFLLIEKALARLGTHRIVAVSEQQRQEISEKFGVGRKEQFVVIPLGLDLSPFAGWQNRRHIFRQQLPAGDDEVVVGIVGRLTDVKNHQLFLEAVSIFKKDAGTDRRVKFVIIGDGGLRRQLENQVKELGLEADVTLAGNRTDPQNFYPALDIVALTSKNEGTPLTLIEAMANERAVIATAVGGVVDLLGEPVSGAREGGYVVCERGVRVPASDAQSFAAGLARLVSDGRLRAELGERGLRFVEQHHSKERLLSDVKNLYGELMQLAPETLGVRSPEEPTCNASC
ncbi:MAG TPA: glycosyltransferase [Pyrinomonadaceae bacterium]|nr:glycosyltransferase [Pyrinomonadaceae bacterium]